MLVEDCLGSLAERTEVQGVSFIQEVNKPLHVKKVGYNINQDKQHFQDALSVIAFNYKWVNTCQHSLVESMQRTDCVEVQN